MAKEGRAPSRRLVRIGRAVAIAADALQLVFFPLFAEGFGSVANDLLDVVVCVTMLRLFGWNPLFLPTFVAEMLPVFDLAPTWTIAVLIATRSRRPAPGEERLNLRGAAASNEADCRKLPPATRDGGNSQTS